MNSKKKPEISIAVASGKGGTGKTLISTNLFYLLQQQNHNVVLVDCDVEEPNSKIFLEGEEIDSVDITQMVPVIDSSKCTFCGKCQEYCNYGAIFIIKESRVIKVIEDLCHDCGACLYACKYDAIEEKEVVLGDVRSYDSQLNSQFVIGRARVGVYSAVSIIKSAINKAESGSIVIMDAPPGTSCSFIQTVNMADYVILITEPTPFGLNDLKQSIETLKILNKPCGVIVNRAGFKFEELYHFIDKNKIPLLLEIPFDKEIASLYSKGELVAKYKSEWDHLLTNMFNTIYEEYGDSSN